MPLDVVTQFPLEKEYKKDTKISPTDIAQLRSWLITQPHLPADHITDLDLILAYHACQRSTEVTKQVLDLNFTLRTLYTDIFKNWIVNDSVEHALNTFLMTPLPTRSRDGSACIYMRLLDCNPKNFNLIEIFRALMMITEAWQYEEGSWPGLLLVVDLQGLALGHLAQFDLKLIQQFFIYLQEAMFVKLKGLHYINAPSFMDKMLALFKPFLKKNLLDVLHIHQAGFETLESFFPRNALPKETGGSYKSLLECKDAVLSKLKAAADFFEQESRKRVQESLRPGQHKTVADFCSGVEGSFKTLSVD